MRLVLGAAAGCAAVILTPANAHERASRVIDRTYSCESGYLGGIYQTQLEVFGKRRDPVAGDTLAYGELTTTLSPNPRLAGVGPTWLDINPTYCRPRRARGPITTRGLSGGVVGPLGRLLDCETPKHLVVRIRGLFNRPTSLRRTQILDLTLLRAEGPARETTIALSTAKGRQIAVVTMAGGTARLFTSPSCRED